MSGFELTRVPLEDLPFQDHFLQTSYWAEIKRSQKWIPYSFTISVGEQKVPFIILVRPIPLAGFLGYVPHGPLLSPASPTQRSIFLADLARTLKKWLPKQLFAVRFDLLWGAVSDLERDRSGHGAFPDDLPLPMRKSVNDVQAPDTVIVPLNEEPEALLSKMKKKTRYNIRLAEKKGVEVRISDEEDLRAWYQVFVETSERDKIAIHPFGYYLSVYKEAMASEKDLDVALFTARHEGDFLGGIMVLRCGKRVTYLYGASSNAKRNLMAPYLLQWKAILWAKDSGAASYDFYGIPPNEEGNHPMEGLYRFKTGFGGEIHHRLGCWDMPVRKLGYGLFRLMEGVRTWYYKKFKKR